MDYQEIEKYKQITGQKGSNEGGTYREPGGSLVYIKVPKSDSHAENEILASKLYSACGINAVEVHKGEREGHLVTVSPIVDSGSSLAQNTGDPKIIKQLQSGFAVDCWLANWDVVGAVNDNVIIDLSGQPVRVDPGGALLYRAQGGEKGNAFGDIVHETKTLLNPSTAPQASKIFGDMTIEEQKESAKKLLPITPEFIQDLVEKTISDPKEQEVLKDKLIARRENILQQYGLDDKTTKALIIPATVTPSKLTNDLTKKWEAEKQPEPKPEPKLQPKTPTIAPPVTGANCTEFQFQQYVHEAIAATIGEELDLLKTMYRKGQRHFLKSTTPYKLAELFPDLFASVNFAQLAVFKAGAAEGKTYSDIISLTVATSAEVKALPSLGEEPTPSPGHEMVTLSKFTEFVSSSYKSLPIYDQAADKKNLENSAIQTAIKMKADFAYMWGNADLLSGYAYFDGKMSPSKYIQLIKNIIKLQPDYDTYNKPAAVNVDLSVIQIMYFAAVEDMVFNKNNSVQKVYNEVIKKMLADNPVLNGVDFNKPFLASTNKITYGSLLLKYVAQGNGMKLPEYTGMDTGQTYEVSAPLHFKDESQQDIEKKRMNSPVTHQNYMQVLNVTPKLIKKFYPDDGIYTTYESYLGGGYGAINDELRTPGSQYKHRNSGGTGSSPEFKKDVKKLDKLINDHGVTIPTGTVLHRGGHAFGIGQHIEPGFLSTSVDYNIAYRFYGGTHQKVYTIIVSEPIKAAPVRNIALQNGQSGGNAVNEHEVLFPTNCVMVVTGKTYPDGSWEMLLYAPK